MLERALGSNEAGVVQAMARAVRHDVERAAPLLPARWSDVLPTPPPAEASPAVPSPMRLRLAKNLRQASLRQAARAAAVASG